jgi:hypothetical protein
MQNLPGVSVQDGKYKYEATIKYLIDGKQTALTGFGEPIGY